jgi:hypothetical protein
LQQTQNNKKNIATKFCATILQQIPRLLNCKNCNKLKNNTKFYQKNLFQQFCQKIPLLLNCKDCNKLQKWTQNSAQKKLKLSTTLQQILHSTNCICVFI